MKDKPLVSILSPCYNVEMFLPQCLDSIVNQTYTNLQIVLIDDGSKDNTWRVLQDYASRDSHIEIYHQENQGVASTRNNLLDKVKGDYVLFVDSDDWIETDMVESLLKLTIKHDADITECKNVINDNVCNKENEEITIWEQEEAIHQFLRHTIFSGSLWNKLFKSCLIKNERFANGISYGEDALFCWHVLQNTKKVVRTTQEYYHYRMNDSSISHQNWTPEKKGTGSKVWKTISEECAVWWHKYEDIAKATYAISDMWQLYYAAQSNYPKDENILRFQKNLRKHLMLIYHLKLINHKKMLFALVASYCYWACKFLK
ncbi:MAG: glycosyltransferase [Aeriscardovia sp.]|nr:glycosyltransferase [Aeriscardovia sp.]